MKKNYLQFAIILLILFLLFPIGDLDSKSKAKKPSDRAIMHNNKGVTALYDGNTERAIFEFKTATELSPDYVEAWNNLGLAYKFQGKTELAIQAFKKAIYLDKKYASPYNHLGAMYYNVGRFDEAIAEFKKAIRYNNKFSDAYYNMGITYVAMAEKSGNDSKLAEAEKTLVKATTINAEHPYAHNELAKVYQKQQKFEQAIIRYKLALEINPDLAESWINLASLYNQTGQVLKAQQALNRAMANNPQSPQVHMNLGISYLKEKNYRLALKEFDLVIQHMPTNEMAYFNAGFTHYNLGVEAKNKGMMSEASKEFDQAINAYESALRLKPNFADAAYNAAFTYQMGNDIPNAIRYYQKTLRIDPGHARTLYTLGSLYQSQGDTANASKYYCQFLNSKTADVQIDINQLKAQVGQWGGCK